MAARSEKRGYHAGVSWRMDIDTFVMMRFQSGYVFV